MLLPTPALWAATRTRLCLAASLLLPCLWCSGALLLDESFEYTNGPLAMASEGLWFNTSGTPTNTLGIANERALLEESDAEDLASLIPGGPFNSSTNVILYWRFRLTQTKLPSGNGDYVAHLSGTANRARVFVTTNGAAPDTFRVGIANGASSVSALHSQDIPLNSEAVIVVKYNPATASSMIWVDPTEEGDTSASATDAASTSSVSRVALRQTSGIGILFIDDLRISTNFNEVYATASPTLPLFVQHPQSQTATEGQSVILTASAVGTQPMAYQWLFEEEPISNATNSSLVLMGLTTNQSGTYTLSASNIAGPVLSDPATLVVNPKPDWDGSLKVLSWNVKGNNATNWSVTSPQVQAIGRILNYLAPDVITFNEIPVVYTWEMTNWVAAFLPGWYLATNSGSDGFIRSVIASRFQILSSRKNLDGVSLSPFGSGNFTRDLFQASVRVPGYAQPVDVFTTHLKATTSSPQSDADKRGAEAMAISNFFVTVYLPTNKGAAYVLTGDLNEDIFRPDTSRYTSKLPIQSLVNAQSGLALTTPVNAATLQDFTLSIQSTLNVRFDYVLPSASLAPHAVSSQVFRTDVLTNPVVTQVLSNDSRVASDHLPVLATFGNPNWPVRPLVVNGDNKVLSWETAPGEQYKILSSDLLQTPAANWTVEAASFTATNYVSTVTLIKTGSQGFFKIERLP